MHNAHRQEPTCEIPNVGTDAAFAVPFVHRFRVTRQAFDPGNSTLADALGPIEGRPHRVLAVIDGGVDAAWPDLTAEIERYAAAHENEIDLADEMLIVPGGEIAKNDRTTVDRVTRAINEHRICRHSYVMVIGGGAVLDAAGFAAATAHRGVRLVRLPTTTLAQADSGVGVKNGVNAFGKKNFVGAFAPPWAVINDVQFLHTLQPRDWRSGFSEAVKVACIKDRAFFEHIETVAARLDVDRIDETTIRVAEPIITRAAMLHLEHITEGGDPFELTRARPLDFGHWAAHMLEQLTDFELRHGEAVAIGLAIDIIYSTRIGLLEEDVAGRILRCLRNLGYSLEHPVIGDGGALLRGLEEFREHLGGPLTITLLTAIGEPIDVYEIDTRLMQEAVGLLRRRVTTAA